MNWKNFAPNDESAGKHEQAKVRRVFFLEANEQFAKTIDKRVSNFHDPTPCFKVRIALKLQLFLAARPEVSDQSAPLHFVL